MNGNAIDHEKFLKIIGLTSLANEVDKDVIVTYGGETDTEIYINIEIILDSFRQINWDLSL